MNKCDEDACVMGVILVLHVDGKEAGGQNGRFVSTLNTMHCHLYLWLYVQVWGETGGAYFNYSFLLL